MSVRSPFESLLQETARLKDWTFIAELSGKSGGAVIRPDGTLARPQWIATWHNCANLERREL